VTIEISKSLSNDVSMKFFSNAMSEIPAMIYEKT
jgi:hypothetical protein